MNASTAQAAATPAGLLDRRAGSRPLTSAAGGVEGLTDRRLVVHPEADPTFVEQYRRLGAAVHHTRLEKGIRTVLVASAVAEDGKTLSATNLALTLSQSFTMRVLLVDGDLRKPAVHQLLELQNVTGLSDILRRPVERFRPQSLSPTLSVVTGGSHAPDPVALIVSTATERFLADARERFDVVVVDSPPAVLFPDAGLLAARLDTCVMVVSATSTAPSAAQSAISALGDSRILGVVLNRAERSEIAAGYGYSRYGYGHDVGRGRISIWWRRRRG